MQMKMEQIEKITSSKTRKVLPAFVWRRRARNENSILAQ
jgi:hypothetical protein